MKAIWANPMLSGKNFTAEKTGMDEETMTVWAVIGRAILGVVLMLLALLVPMFLYPDIALTTGMNLQEQQEFYFLCDVGMYFGFACCVLAAVAAYHKKNIAVWLTCPVAIIMGLSFYASFQCGNLFAEGILYICSIGALYIILLFVFGLRFMRVFNFLGGLQVFIFAVSLVLLIIALIHMRFSLYDEVLENDFILLVCLIFVALNTYVNYVGFRVLREDLIVIKSVAEEQVPRYMAWYAALSILITVLWICPNLFILIISFIANKINGNDDGDITIEEDSLSEEEKDTDAVFR